MTDSTGWSDPEGSGQRPITGGKPGVIPLRPLGVGEILDGAISTMRKHAGVVFGVSAVVALVGALLYLAADVWLLGTLEPVPALDPTATEQEQMDRLLDDLSASLSANGVVAVITLLTQTFLTGFLVVVVGKAVLGRRVTFGEVWNDLKHHLLPLLGLTIVVTILVVVGLVLLVIPGIYLYVLLSLATPALILERGRVGGAMSRSRLLVTGSWWRVFGVLLLAAVIAGVLAVVIQLPFGLITGAPAPGTAYSMGDLVLLELGAAVAQTITVPFAACVTALLYIDQRMRREGLDIELSRSAGMA